MYQTLNASKWICRNINFLHHAGNSKETRLINATCWYVCRSFSMVALLTTAIVLLQHETWNLSFVVLVVLTEPLLTLVGTAVSPATVICNYLLSLAEWKHVVQVQHAAVHWPVTLLIDLASSDLASSVDVSFVTSAWLQAHHRHSNVNDFIHMTW